jgi:hypothetical protein
VFVRVEHRTLDKFPSPPTVICTDNLFVYHSPADQSWATWYTRNCCGNYILLYYVRTFLGSACLCSTFVEVGIQWASYRSIGAQWCIFAFACVR